MSIALALVAFAAGWIVGFILCALGAHHELERLRRVELEEQRKAEDEAALVESHYWDWKIRQEQETSEWS